MLVLMRPVTDIFRFVDYPSWLRAEYEGRKTAKAGFTHRAFSAICGYKSSGALALIMSGRRNLSRTAAQRVAEAFSLNAGERAHLMRMLDLEGAEDFAARAAVLDRMRASKQFVEHYRGTIDAYAYYVDPWAPVVMELVALDDFVEDPAWIAERLHAGVDAATVADALRRLEETGQLRRDESGQLMHGQRVVATAEEVPAEVRSEALKRFQRQMMALAGDALDSQERERRDMRVTTMAISRDQAARLKAVMTQLHREVLAIVSEDEPIEVVYQLNTQLFALTDLPASIAGDARGGDA